MQLLGGPSQLLLALVLQVAPAQISHPPERGPTKVMMFEEVWAKSMCQPMEQLVDVEQEYPGELEYTYMPSCVPLKRCSGCCGDEHLECQPTLESNVTLQVIKIQQTVVSMHYVEITFVEHQRCECRLKHHKKSFSHESSDFVKNKLRRMKHKKAADSCGNPMSEVWQRPDPPERVASSHTEATTARASEDVRFHPDCINGQTC